MAERLATVSTSKRSRSSCASGTAGSSGAGNPTPTGRRSRRKPPYSRLAPDRHASSTKPETWSSVRPRARRRRGRQADGVGFALEPPFVGVDLDEELPAARPRRGHARARLLQRSGRRHAPPTTSSCEPTSTATAATRPASASSNANGSSTSPATTSPARRRDRGAPGRARHGARAVPGGARAARRR